MMKASLRFTKLATGFYYWVKYRKYDHLRFIEKSGNDDYLSLFGFTKESYTGSLSLRWL